MQTLSPLKCQSFKQEDDQDRSFSKLRTITPSKQSPTDIYKATQMPAFIHMCTMGSVTHPQVPP